MPISPHDFQTGGALQGAVAASLVHAREAAAELAPGARVGAFRVVRELGRGGMAVVYLAERADGEYDQRIALKWMRATQAGETGEALFRRERQALADLRHPHIARLIDGGHDADGRPWFAMEYIDGEPLDRHCITHALPLPDRLKLFRQVCDAVAFAHARGLIHRDIKPNNVLVDSDGSARLLDFGIAQLMGEENGPARHACTPGFASPEQLRGETPTVASDIYQLGCVLASLLDTDAGDAESRPTGEATRATTWTPSDAPAAARPAVPQGVPSDLAAILGKATSLDPSSRHPTAEALADDVRAFLEHRPVSARPRTAAYVTSRFVRRHPVATALAALALAQLVAGSIGIALQARQTRAARDEAVARAGELEKVANFQSSQLAGIDTRQMGVQLRRSLLEAVAEPDRDDLDASLASVNFTDLSLKTLDSTIFSSARHAIERDFTDQPAIMAHLLQTLATTTRKLGLLDFASEPQRKALEIRRAQLGETHPATLHSRDESGELLLQTNRLAQAEAEFRAALPLAIEALGARHDTTLDLQTGLALALQEQGKLAEAEAPLRHVLKQRLEAFGTTREDTPSAMNNLGNLLQELGRHDEAEPLLKRAIELRRSLHAEGHPGISVAMVNLGGMYLHKRDYEKAEATLREATELLRRHQGDDHHLTLTAANNLGVVLQMQGKLQESEPWTRMAMEGRARTLGVRNKDTLSATNAYAVLLAKQGRSVEAEALQRRLLDTARDVLGADDYLLGIYGTGLGTTLTMRKQRQEAERVLLDARDVFARGVGLDHPYARRNAEALAQLHADWEQAEPGGGHAASAAHWQSELASSRPPATD